MTKWTTSDRELEIVIFIYLSVARIPAFEPGVEYNEDQYGSHNDHVDNDNKSLFHTFLPRHYETAAITEILVTVHALTI